MPKGSRNRNGRAAFADVALVATLAVAPQSGRVAIDGGRKPHCAVRGNR